MTPDHSLAGRSFWLWWILASALSFSISAIPVFLYFSSDATSFFVAQPIAGTIIGVSQWLVLKRHMPRAGWWILASALGFSISAPILLLTYGGFTVFLVEQLIAGAIIGVSQWLVLKRHMARAGWWILASALGFSISAIPIFLFVYGASTGFLMVFLIVMWHAMAGAVIGAITGALLVWLLRQPAPIARQDKPEEPWVFWIGLFATSVPIVFVTGISLAQEQLGYYNVVVALLVLIIAVPVAAVIGLNARDAGARRLGSGILTGAAVGLIAGSLTCVAKFP